MQLRSFIRMLILLGVLLAALPAAAQEPTQFVGDPSLPAPAFPADLDWLNVEAPLTLEQLRGKAVLLDFWTYGCINCIHMIPVMKQLEAKYGDALAVIGVHSAKFANEGETENIRQIVQRYGLAHPVINDSDFAVWYSYASYGVNAWPTFVLIDPRGNLFAVQAGEIPFDAFDRVIGGMISYFDSVGEINRDALPIAVEGANDLPGALSFPGQLTVDTAGGRLFIADSSHNRIIIADLNTYEVLDIVGSGAAGLSDGAFDQATFNKPQGLALSGDLLYVADTDNHAIRAINLFERTVSTVAGTGVQGTSIPGVGAALETDLRSPWDVEFGDANTLYIAMAGTHQIWELTLDNQLIAPLVGSGREGLLDGPFAAAQLAQPSGLFFRDGVLYFADSESSSIRAANITDSTVQTLAGPVMNNLFDFGDEDGGVGDSRLQHALAVTGGADGPLYVADTYNSKIKLLDPQAREISTLFGLGGLGGFRDGGAAEAEFDEPGGLAYADGKLYVADTNNDAIRVIDLASGVVSTVNFPNPEALQIDQRVTVVGGSQGQTVTLDAQTVAPGAGEIVLNITLPEGYKLNTLAPFNALWSSDSSSLAIAEADREQSLIAPEMPLRLPVTLSEGSATLSAELTTYYCEAVNESLCFIDRVTITLPVTVAAGASGSALSIERALIPPRVPTGGLG